MKNVKTIKNLVQTCSATLLTLMLLSTAALASPDLEGSFKGKYINANRARVDLVIRSLSGWGRDGSYMAVLLQDHPLKIVTYLIDPTDDGNFVMQPRQVTSDGDLIGYESFDPSLVLTVTGSRGNDLHFNIGSAHSSNRNGFEGAMVFEGCDHSDLSWQNAPAGVYSKDGIKIEIPSEMVDHQATLTLTAPRENGVYHLRESAPGIYTLREVQYTGDGTFRARYPSKIALFLSKPSLFGSNYLTFINPGDYTDVEKFVRRPWNQ